MRHTEKPDFPPGKAHFRHHYNPFQRRADRDGQQNARPYEYRNDADLCPCRQREDEPRYE